MAGGRGDGGGGGDGGGRWGGQGGTPWLDGSVGGNDRIGEVLRVKMMGHLMFLM